MTHPFMAMATPDLEVDRRDLRAALEGLEVVPEVLHPAKHQCKVGGSQRLPMDQCERADPTIKPENQSKIENC